MTASSTEASILLVDDEPHITEALRRHFPKQTYQVLTATSAAAACNILDQHSIDVVVSDERMPGESGAEFLAHVRQRFPKIIRMILSGQASLEATIRAINDGEVYRFFLKPCNPADLIQSIQRALEHRQLAEQSWALLREFRAHAALLEASQAGKLLEVRRDASGAIVMDDSDINGSVNDLLTQIEATMASERQRLTRALDTQTLRKMTD